MFPDSDYRHCGLSEQSVNLPITHFVSAQFQFPKRRIVAGCVPTDGATRQWSFLGCLGTEQRSIAAWSVARKEVDLVQTRLLRIKDKPSRHSIIAEERLKQRREEFVGQGGNDGDIREYDLFCPHADIINEIESHIENAQGAVMIDITSLPKRFFFPMIRRILTSPIGSKITDLVATYSIPKMYPREPLAENFEEWAHLPLFGGAYSAERCEMLVVGVGFQALGLHEHLKGVQGLQVTFLVPFPAPPPAFQRSWELLRQLRNYGPSEMFDQHRASAKDPSDTFDRLVSVTGCGQRRIALAPFGPKPMSLAMCIFASLGNCEVFYTQPSVYHPDYSIGLADKNGNPEVYGYCVRIAGRDFFSLT